MSFAPRQCLLPFAINILAPDDLVHAALQVWGGNRRTLLLFRRLPSGRLPQAQGTRRFSVSLPDVRERTQRLLLERHRSILAMQRVKILVQFAPA
jgi:hypothetical protein